MSEQIGEVQQGEERVAFTSLVLQKIEEAPDVAIKDPYQEEFGTPMVMNYDHLMDSKGKITFGSMYRTRHIMLDRVELVYAYNTKRNTAEFYANVFKPQGGLAERFIFTERDGRVNQRYQSAPFGSELYATGPYFSSNLTPEKEQLLINVLNNPEASQTSLVELLRPTADEVVMLEANREEMRRNREELRRELDEITEAHRRAAREASNVIIGHSLAS